MTKYICTACNKTDESPCILEVIEGNDSPAMCPYRYDMDDIADWKRVADPAAIEAESIIHGYTFRAQEIEINTKDDVNDVILQLQDCITDLISIEWPEDKERIAKLLQVTA